MPRFYVWAEGYEPDPITDASQVEAYDEESAAEAFVEHRHSELDYPEEIDICVRPVGGGETTQWSVWVESVPSAHATRKD